MGQLRIDQMYAFVVMDDDDTEGVIGFWSKGSWMPMVGADMDRVNQLKPAAQRIADMMNKDVHVVQFTNRIPVETLVPKGNHNGRVHPDGDAGGVREHG